MTTTELQLALDDIDRDGALALLALLEPFVDIIEVGTPLVMRYGLGLVSEIAARYPRPQLLCDAKIVDAAFLEATMAFEAGADIVTVLAMSDDVTVAGAVAAAKAHESKVMADLLGVATLVDRARELQTLGVDIVAVHTGVDRQARGASPLSDLRELAEADLDISIAVAGGITPDNVVDYVDARPDVVIVGSGITNAAAPLQAAERIRALLDGPRR